VQTTTLSGLVQIDLRGGATLRLCDGGIVTWGANVFASKDNTFGSIGGMEPLSEGVGDEVPALRMTFFPESTAAAADLVQPGWQASPMKFWIAEVDRSTGEVTGTPELMLHGQLDTADLEVGQGTRSIIFDVVSTAERLLEGNQGNTLSPRFHKSVWPGETGEDAAIGIGITVAWGVEAPAGGGGAVYGGGGGGGGNGIQDIQPL